MVKKKGKTVVKTIVVKQKGPKSKKKKGAKQMGHPAKNHGHVVQSICGLTDPFCRHAIGKKWPDTSTLNSTPFVVRGSFTMDTDAAGLGAAVIVPSLNYGYSIGAIALGVATFPALTAYPNISAITASTSQFRLVSGGITVNSIMTPLTASGYVFLQELAPGGNADLTTMSVSSTSNSAWFRQPNKINHPISYIFKPGGNDSRRFRSINASSSISSVDSNDFTMVQVNIVGPATTTAALVVDYIFHYELVFKAGDAMNLMVTPSRGSDTVLAQLATDAFVHQPAFLTGAQEQVSGHLSDIASRMVAGAKPAIKGVITTGVTAYAGPLAGGIASAAMSGL